MSVQRINTVADLVSALAALPPDRKVLMWPLHPDQATRLGLVPAALINQDDEGDPNTACIIFEPATEYATLFHASEWFVA